MNKNPLKTSTDLGDKKSILSVDQIKENLEFSELRYRRLFESAQDGILILDAKSGRIIDSNPFIEKILGYKHTEILNKHLWDIGILKDLQTSRDSFLELQKKGYVRYEDIPLETKNGRKVDVEFVSNKYFVKNIQVIQCNIRDITKRKKIQDAIKDKSRDLGKLNKNQEKTKEALLNVMEDLESAKKQIEIEKIKDEAMLASIGEGLIAVDENEKIVIANKAALELLGYKVTDLLGKSLNIVSIEDEEGNLLSLAKQPFSNALKSGEYISKVLNFLKKNKKKFQ